MYAGKYALERAGVPAFIMASSGESVSYAEFDSRTNRLAHLLRAQGLKRLDHYAIYMENNSRYLEACGEGERAGLYYTCVNSYLTPDELAYILQNSESRVLITSAEKYATASQALKACPNVRLCLVVGGGATAVHVHAPVTLELPAVEILLGVVVARLQDHHVVAGRRNESGQVDILMIEGEAPDVIVLPDEPFRFRPSHVRDFDGLRDVPAVRAASRAGDLDLHAAVGGL